MPLFAMEYDVAVEYRLLRWIVVGHIVLWLVETDQGVLTGAF